jgi:hypothetical protein
MARVLVAVHDLMEIIPLVTEVYIQKLANSVFMTSFLSLRRHITPAVHTVALKNLRVIQCDAMRL